MEAQDSLLSTPMTAAEHDVPSRSESLRVLVVSSDWESAADKPAPHSVPRQAEQLRGWGVEVHGMAFAEAKNPALWVRARREIESRLRDRPYDVIHAERALPALLAMWSNSDVPLVVTLHDGDVEAPPKPSPVIERRVIPRLGRWVARRADEVIVLSEHAARLLGDGAPANVIPWGDVDLDVFRPGSKDDARRSLDLPVGRKLVLYPARPFWRFHWYERAVDAVRHLRPRFDATLITIEEQSAEKVARYMVACDALLLVQEMAWREIRVKQALASGLPVVSVGIEEIADLLAGVPGCTMCEDRRPEGIAAALERAFEAPSVRSNVVADFDQRTPADRVLSVYRSVRGRPRWQRS